MDNPLPEAANQNSGTHNEQAAKAATTEREALLLIRSWLQSIARKLTAARSIIVSDAQIEALATMLAERQYSADAMRLAAEWILWGNWQFKKRNILEFSDFYPMPEQIRQTAADSGLVVLTQGELKTRLQSAYHDGFNDGRPQNKLATDTEKAFVSEINRLFDKTLEQGTEIDELKKTVQQQKKLIEAMKERHLAITHIPHINGESQCDTL